MHQIINDRISSLREVMKKNKVSACIIPGTDPHASEYIADCWKEREWISGFDGSAGTVAITMNQAGLWTDSRYFLQGSEQLQGTGIELMKQGLPETPDISTWLAGVLNKGEIVGVNPQLFSHNAYVAMQNELGLHGLKLQSIDLLAQTWTKRPPLPNQPIYVFDEQYAGQSAKNKLTEIRKKVAQLHAETLVLSALDDIAWLFNIRGNDVDYNPVAIAYALVENEKATLFIHPEKLNEATKEYLHKQGVETAAYESIYDALRKLKASSSVLIDGSKLNQSLYEAIPATCAIRNAMSPVFIQKSIKNTIEIEGIRKAMVKDGVALTRFFIWLEENISSGTLTEISIADKLREFRSQEANFVGESFSTIAGYAGHGAIVHYKATPRSNAHIKPEGILLLDSGAQFLDGTTDITRTIALGTPTQQQKSDYTKVLKGHIALSTALFPVGTRGSQLDILARKALWDEGLNYGHGTGHGVGHFLCVHEGPQNIRMDENSTTLQPGMIVSNEPGMYRANEYGIRIENLLLVTENKKTEFGQFLSFETLTFFPIDTTLVDIKLLTDEEIAWLNNYHQTVVERLSSHLSGNEHDWLKKKCQLVSC